MSDRLDAAVNALIPMESFHRNVSADKLASLRKQALQTLVDDELEYQDGVQRGVKVPAADVESGLAQMIKQYGGRPAFDQALARAGASMASARAEVRRSLTIRRTQELAVASCKVGPDDAERFFNENPDRFVEPEQLHIYAITVGVDPSSTSAQWAAAKTRAAEVLKELRAGGSFEELARKHSTDASSSKGGDMGFVHRGSLNPQFEQALKDLPVGRPSDVVETLYGYHIVQVAEIRPPRKRTFADVRPTLLKDLAVTRCAEMRDAWIAKLRSAAAIEIVEP